MSKIPKGCDRQGRYPAAAESSTELGADEDHGLRREGAWISAAMDILIVLVVLAIIMAIISYFSGVVGY